jgi:hypothetical protein
MQPTEPPADDPAVYAALRERLGQSGPAAAIEELCTQLRQSRDYSKLFYALLLKKRFHMGVTPIPTAAAADMSAEQQEEYEAAVRGACREVGKLFLDAGNIPAAFEYMRMINEPGPVADALENYTPSDETDLQPVIDIAFHHGLNPKRGFDLVLDRYGICSAITFLSGGFSTAHPPEVRNHCIGRLVRSLHQQLLERLQMDIQRQQGFAPSATTIPELIAGRDWLFADDAYHVDISHLSSVVQMSIELGDPADLHLARELCAYGKRLSPTLQYPGHAPFDRTYEDVDLYLSALLGEEVEAGIEHFRAKITSDPDGPDALCAAVLVKLLLRLDRQPQALEVAQEFLAQEDERQLPCPGPFELAVKLGDYEAFAATARKRHDPVHFLAGLVAAIPSSSPR